jgi:hypothetical protein
MRRFVVVIAALAATLLSVREASAFWKKHHYVPVYPGALQPQGLPIITHQVLQLAPDLLRQLLDQQSRITPEKMPKVSSDVAETIKRVDGDLDKVVDKVNKLIDLNPDVGGAKIPKGVHGDGKDSSDIKKRDASGTPKPGMAGMPG